MFAELKSRILKLLREDREFRYAVAGLIGLEEILKRLDALTVEQTKIWDELKALREDMVKGFKRYDEEISKLREDFNKMLKEQVKLREEQTKIWREVRGLQEGHRRLEKRLTSLESAMISGFRDISKFAGMTFEEFVRRFLTTRLREAGEIPSDAELKKATIDGEEVNLFLEEPLIIGEVTAYAETVDDVRRLLRKAELARARYGREPKKLLVVLTAPSNVAAELRKVAGESGVELIVGKTA